VLALLVAVALATVAPAPSSASTQNSESLGSSRAVRDLANLALVAPPELAADVLLKLIERGYIGEAERKRQVLETAWSLAASAKYPLEVVPAMMTVTASDPGSLSAALGMGLSKAGIEARVISQMAKLDPKETRNLFVQMTTSETQSPECAADRYTTNRAYFRALQTAAQTFSAEEVKKGERFRFLAEGLRVLSSPEDFELSLELLRNDRGLTEAEFGQLLGLWSEMLTRVRFTDRLFSSRSIEELATALLYAGKEIERRGTSTKPAFRALRAYFVTHARAARCGESESRVGAEEQVRVMFNKVVALATPDIPLIAAGDIKPESFGERAKVAVYDGAEDATIRELKSDYAQLRFGTFEKDEALQFLNKLERWSKDGRQSNREIFFQRAELQGALVYAAPEGQLRQLFLESYVRFLANSSVKLESPPEWSMWVNRLISAAGISDRRAWLDQIERAGDSVVAIYCQIARVGLASPPSGP